MITTQVDIIEAIEGAIKKWEGIIEGKLIDNGGTNCPLCRLFCACSLPDSCIGCPIWIETGKIYCEATPYDAWREYNCAYVFDDESRQLAQDELDFLKNLLNKYEHRKVSCHYK